MGCTASKPLHFRAEYAWADATQNHGSTIQQGCFPYNQVIAPKGFYNFSTTLSKNPDAVDAFQIRLRRPDGREICPGANPAACLKPVTNQLCQTRSYPSDYNVIRHHPGTVGTIPGSSLINCTWNDLMPYDLTAVPGTGSMQFEIMTHLHIFKDGQSPKKPSSAKRFYAQMLPTLPVMTNQPLKPCDGPRAGDGKYCDYSSPDAHTLNVKGWNEKTQFTQVEFAPYFLIPVGGIWRTLMSASRMVEPPPPKYPYPGYPDFAGSYTDVPAVKYVQTAGSVDYKLNAYLPGRTSNWIKLQFDLSFLSTQTIATSAEVHIYVSNVNLDTATLAKGVVDVYDGSRTLSRKGHTLPCVPPFCTTARKLGTGSFNGVAMGKIRGSYMKLTVDPSYLRNFVGKPNLMPLVLVMPQQPGRTKVTGDGVQFRAKSTATAPMLVIKGSC
ncbi:hypothetical protein D9Q98_003824 [Chlorella vulgaris]|uniref:Uncharacterized protein n=1 Tax=Chlorella vulgaris TaxID=3077 RepID=A0A9D4YXI4_CHLVU|nr:hypothetical protein D9Q98_003824 [Chlorella vulgaris]